jgi:hypothetical protein
MVSARMAVFFAVALGAAALVAPEVSAAHAAAAHVGRARAISPARAAGAVVVGSTTFNASSSQCYRTPSTGDLTMIQATTPTSGPSYTVPADGVLTSFGYRANGAVKIRAVLLRPAGSNTWLLDAKTDTVTAAATALNTFPTRLTAHAGEVLALSSVDAGNQTTCAYGGSGSGGGWVESLEDIDTTTTLGSLPPSGGLVDISAVWEPDADHDGYGDVSQDQCPVLSTTQGPCPVPDTTVTKKPAKHTDSRRVKVKFVSTIAGSTFLCTLDKKPAKPCASPFKKRVSRGKHRLLVQAVTPFGTSDASPATVRWRVLAPPHRAGPHRAGPHRAGPHLAG